MKSTKISDQIDEARFTTAQASAISGASITNINNWVARDPSGLVPFGKGYSRTFSVRECARFRVMLRLHEWRIPVPTAWQIGNHLVGRKGEPAPRMDGWRLVQFDVSKRDIHSNHVADVAALTVQLAIVHPDSVLLFDLHQVWMRINAGVKELGA